MFPHLFSSDACPPSLSETSKNVGQRWENVVNKTRPVIKKKYYQFSFLFKQTDISLGKGFIVRKVICTSASTFWLNTIFVRAWRAPKIDFRSISCISVVGILSIADANRNYRNLAVFSIQFYESRFLFPLFWAKLWVPIVRAYLPRDQVHKKGCIVKLCH